MLNIPLQSCQKLCWSHICRGVRFGEVRGGGGSDRQQLPIYWYWATHWASEESQANRDRSRQTTSAQTQAHKVDVRRTRIQVTIAFKQACDRADINIPYPIRTFYYYNQQQFNDTSPVSDGAQKS